MKKYLKIISSFILGMIGGFLIGKGIYQPKPVMPGDIVIPDSLVQRENDRIDSLSRRGDSLELMNNALKEALWILESQRGVEIEQVKKLSTDDAVKYLGKKLREYENY